MTIYARTYQSRCLQNILRVRKILVGKILANDSQFAKFANIFPHPIIALYGMMLEIICEIYLVATNNNINIFVVVKKG